VGIIRYGKPHLAHIVSAVILISGLTLIVIAAVNIFSSQRNYIAAQNEYEYLRENYAPAALDLQDAISSAGAELGINTATEDDLKPSPGLIDINPDYIGWISLDGTTLNYPIVQGINNDIYLYTTFNGAKNPAGAIFMDYRCKEGFDSPICLIYGHNMKDGSMFAALNQYLVPEFAANHPQIVITTSMGEILTYKVFDVCCVDAWDELYSLDYQSSAASESIIDISADVCRFLILSTCMNGGNKDVRLLVYASLML
jgi:sortase B